MGCFGDMTPTKQVASTSTSTVKPPQWVEDASRSNYDLARSVLDRGYQPYTGEMVAPLSGNERSASDLIAKLSGSSPNIGTTTDRLSSVGNAPAFKYDFSTVVNDNGPLGSVASYMDPYIAQVLDPVLRQIGISGAQARQGINSNATAAGAYGDARHGVVESEQRKNEAIQAQDATAQGYSGAFNSAMGLREQDLQRLFGTQQAQQSANEAALSRMRQSGIDLSNLDQTELGRALGIAGALGQTGATERGVQQAQDTANYNEFLRSKNFTNDEIAFLTSILSGTPYSKTTEGESMKTQSEPNNSGWQAVGALGGTLLNAFI